MKTIYISPREEEAIKRAYNIISNQQLPILDPTTSRLRHIVNRLAKATPLKEATPPARPKPSCQSCDHANLEGNYCTLCLVQLRPGINEVCEFHKPLRNKIKE